MKSQLELAREIATEAHKGQFRRDGVTPYHTHPEAVAERVSDEGKPAAWLHDVLEDCKGWNAGRLMDSGVDERTVWAVVKLTKIYGVDYEAYINSVKQDPIAREVKIADIEHNLASNPKEKNAPKYKRALEILKGSN